MVCKMENIIFALFICISIHKRFVKVGKAMYIGVSRQKSYVSNNKTDTLFIFYAYRLFFKSKLERNCEMINL